jgi:hypothetical protein
MNCPELGLHFVHVAIQNLLLEGTELQELRPELGQEGLLAQLYTNLLSLLILTFLERLFTSWWNSIFDCPNPIFSFVSQPKIHVQVRGE